jgi:hypothetical protein
MRDNNFVWNTQHGHGTGTKKADSGIWKACKRLLLKSSATSKQYHRISDAAAHITGKN